MYKTDYISTFRLSLCTAIIKAVAATHFIITRTRALHHVINYISELFDLSRPVIYTIAYLCFSDYRYLKISDFMVTSFSGAELFSRAIKTFLRTVRFDMKLTSIAFCTGLLTYTRVYSCGERSVRISVSLSLFPPSFSSFRGRSL